MKLEYYKCDVCITKMKKPFYNDNLSIIKEIAYTKNDSYEIVNRKIHLCKKCYEKVLDGNMLYSSIANKDSRIEVYDTEYKNHFKNEL